MIRFDMSEYMEKHSVSKLIGAPPGYVGFEQPGTLTEAIRNHPYSILLFDEIEKAHLDILNLLLQVLDDGILHDSKHNPINFKNTIIILTSNIGSQEILDGHPSKAIEELKKIVRPEFINRLDEIICFNPITDNTIKAIVVKLLNDLSDRLTNENIYINLNDSTLITKIVKDAYDPIYGARPIKRYIQSKVENFLAQNILDRKIKYEIKYRLTCNKIGELDIRETKAD
jgi:ATP-dependent Clp protease ATP-binding subunit ClpB